MKQPKGPEDRPEWKDVAPDVHTSLSLECRHCKKAITFWHCAESGCCWCAKCGANCKPPKEKK